MMRVSAKEIRELLTHASHAKSGKVMYPSKTFDGDLLESIGNDLYDYHCVDARLDRAIELADQREQTEQAKVLRWIRDGSARNAPLPAA